MAHQGSSLFVEDREGDKQNLTYGALDRHAVPRYQHAGHNRLLGVASNFRISFRTKSRLGVEDIEVDSARKSRKQNLLADVAREDQTISIRPGASLDGEIDEDFLRFESERPRKRRRVSVDRLQDTPSGENGESEESGSDVEEQSSHHDAFDVFKSNPVHRRHLELSKATKERPQNISTWIALIDYQQQLLLETGRSVSSKTLTDLKISLYEQALSHIKFRNERHILITGLMREGRAIWDAGQQAQRWGTFLDHEASFDLWKLYVDFVQTSPVKYSFENCLQVYSKWLQKVQGAPSGRSRDSNCIYVLLRLTLLLWQSGFTERAVGIWQALLEWNYYRPRSLQPEHEAPNFQEFWSSEVARTGEQGSQGWSSTTNPTMEPSVDPSSKIELMDLEGWAAIEAELEKTAALPARSLDEVDNDDPYRVVLFSDVQDFLFRPTGEEGRMLLADAFLIFAGLPPVSSLDESSTWMGDPFVSSTSPDGSASSSKNDEATSDFGILARYEKVFLTTKRLCSQTPTAFLSDQGNVLHSYPQFVQTVISQLAKSCMQKQGLEGMMEYAVAFEAGFDLKSARKQAKSFLKSRGDMLRLYDAYAMLEVWHGSFDTAEKVWSTALSMRMSFDMGVRPDALFLWRNWLYACMQQGQFEKARRMIMLMATDGTPNEILELPRQKDDCVKLLLPSATAQIKVGQYLKQQIENALSHGHHRLVVPITDLLAFHYYLHDGLQLEAALRAYSETLERVGGLSATSHSTIEILHEQRARFMYAHAAVFQKSFKPKEASALLSESVRQFPTKLDLLHLQHYFSQRAGIIDRLRQIDSNAGELDQKNGKESVIPGLFDVFLELHRPAYSGSTNHSIRSAFARATESGSPGHDSPEIWKAFVLWEVSLNTVESRPKPVRSKGSGVVAQDRERGTAAVEAFYASLRACPWSKELCMLAFRDSRLRDELGDKALRQAYQSMVERGMRLRIDISESLL